MPVHTAPWHAVTLRWCAPCGSEQPFEVPPCEDGHGEDCLDLACMECGHALVVGVQLPGRPAEVLLDQVA